jgi:hypothetical protein
MDATDDGPLYFSGEEEGTGEMPHVGGQQQDSQKGDDMSESKMSQTCTQRLK